VQDEDDNEKSDVLADLICMNVCI